MSRKYTIVIDPELHDWFAHQSIDVKRSISGLIVDAMNAYRRAHTTKKIVDLPGSSTPDDPTCNDSIPENKPKPYVKTIYHPNTKTLNDTPRAREVSKASRKVVSLLKKADSSGVTAQELHKTLGDAGYSFQICRETLTYLRENEIVKRRRDDWVHSDFYKPPNAKPTTSDKKLGIRG